MKNKKEEILKLVREYYSSEEKKVWKKGDYIPYASRIYDENELVNLVDASLDFWLTSGKYTEEFERKFSDFLGIKYVSLVNSGSSANLLALSSLFSPLLKERRINKGDEVISVAAGFPTTIAPIIQLGLIPVFIDITIPQYNIDVTKLEKALSDKTKVVMLAHSLGNPFDIKAVTEFCRKHDLWLIEDNCDSLGSKYILDNTEKYTGTFGDIATSSFYPAHHMTMGEGGAIYTDNPLLHKIIRSLRDWGRDCVCPPGKDNICGKRFDYDSEYLPAGYDHKYIYSHFGYNLKATDLQAAIGVAQLDKLEEMIEIRKKNFNYYITKLNELKLDEYLILPEEVKNSDPSWFGFMICLKKENITDKLVQFLEKHNIQVRRFFAGNIVRQPCFDEIRDDNNAYRIIDNLDNTDYVMSNSFWLGVAPNITEEMIDYICETIKLFFDGKE